jgi:hypothetical protein
MTCPHQSRPPGKDTGRRLCALGWYGSHPYIGNCNACMRAGDNTPEAKAEADAKAERTHPGGKPRIRGCCDRADQK